MELKDQLVNLKLSRELRDLGVRADSYYTWRVVHEHPDLRGPAFDPYIMESKGSETPASVWYRVPAYSVAELCNLLPKGLVLGGYYCELMIIRSSAWRVHYGLTDKIPESIYVTGDDNLANTLAQMLAHLIKNHLIEMK